MSRFGPKKIREKIVQVLFEEFDIHLDPAYDIFLNHYHFRDIRAEFTLPDGCFISIQISGTNPEALHEELVKRVNNKFYDLLPEVEFI